MHAIKVYELGAGHVYRYAGDECQGVRAVARYHQPKNYPAEPRQLEAILAENESCSPALLRSFEPGDLVWVQHVGFVTEAPGVYDNHTQWRLCVVCAQTSDKQPEADPSESPSVQQLLTLLFRQVQANGRMLQSLKADGRAATPGLGADRGTAVSRASAVESRR